MANQALAANQTPPANQTPAAEARRRRLGSWPPVLSRRWMTGIMD
jgi:hypothetical protein